MQEVLKDETIKLDDKILMLVYKCGHGKFNTLKYL